MQWTPGPQAGFSTNANTWLPIPANYSSVNVESERADPASLLNWTEKLIALRRSTPALHDGGTVFLDSDSSKVLAYVRTAPAGQSSVVVAMNMTAQPQTITLDATAAGLKGSLATTLAATSAGAPAQQKLSAVTLAPYAAWVGAVQ